MPLGLVEAGGELVEVAATAAAPAWRRRRGPGSAAACAAAPGRPVSQRVAEARRATAVAAVENGPSCSISAADVVGPTRLRLRATGVAWRGEAAEVGHQRRQLAQEARAGAGCRRSMSARRSAVASPVALACTMKSATLLLLARERRERAVGVARELGQHPVLAGEDGEHLVGLAQRRVGAVDHLVQLLAAAGEAGAELVEQDRQPLAVRAAHDVVDQVEVDRRAGAARAAAGAGPRRRRRRSAPAPGWPPCPGSHSTNFSPISDCGRTVHLRVRAERGEAVVVDAAARPRPSCRRSRPSTRSRRPWRPATFTSSPGTADGHVVEDRAHLVARRRSPSAPSPRAPPRRAARAQSTTTVSRRRISSGRRGRGGRSRRPRTARSRRARPAWRRPGSAGLAQLEAVEPRCESGYCGQRRRSTSLTRERAEHRLDARVVAVGVVGGGALAELGEPAGQVGRVLAQRVDEVLRAVEASGSCAGRRCR